MNYGKDCDISKTTESLPFWDVEFGSHHMPVALVQAEDEKAAIAQAEKIVKSMDGEELFSRSGRPGNFPGLRAILAVA